MVLLLITLFFNEKMKNDPRPYFSIILCLYNIENYFNKGIACVLAQDFKDYEILLIDDGSTDSTSSQCDEISDSCPNINVIHQDNRGLGGARNTGIEAARGKYLCFFDIDDEVGNNWLQNIYDEIKEINPDLLIYGYKEVNIKLHSENSFRFERNLLTDKSLLAKEFVEILSGLKFNNGFAWNKVYRRNFILENGLRFSKDVIQQDEIFNHRVYERYPSILISDKILYNYYIYDKGINRKRYLPQRIRYFENVKGSFIEIKNNLGIKDERLDKYIHLRFIRNVLYNRNPLNSFKDRKSFYANIINNNQVIDSLDYLKKNKLNIKNIHDLFFKISYMGIRKKSQAILIITDYLYSGIHFLSFLIRK